MILTYHILIINFQDLGMKQKITIHTQDIQKKKHMILVAKMITVKTTTKFLNKIT